MQSEATMIRVSSLSSSLHYCLCQTHIPHYCSKLFGSGLCVVNLWTLRDDVLILKTARLSTFHTHNKAIKWCFCGLLYGQYSWWPNKLWECHMLGSKIWIANQLDQPVGLYGQIAPFFLEEVNVTNIFTFLERNTSNDPGIKRSLLLLFTLSSKFLLGTFWDMGAVWLTAICLMEEAIVYKLFTESVLKDCLQNCTLICK